MSFIVVDASVSAVWFMEDEEHPVADATLESLDTIQAIVPQIWHFEIRNVLVVSERRGRTTRSHNERHLNAINEMQIQTDQNPDLDVAMDLARRHNLTFYDAIYLELAIRRNVQLATLDSDLARAATAEGLPNPSGT